MLAITRYSRAQRALHWISLLLVVLAYLTIEFRGGFERGSALRAAVVQTHFWTGLLAWLLVWPRLWLRAKLGVPPITPAPGRLTAFGAAAVHVALYAFLLAQPLLGLVTAAADGKDLLIPFTSIALPIQALGGLADVETLEELHETIGNVFYFVIGLHAVAAILHHALRHDDTLRRML